MMPGLREEPRPPHRPRENGAQPPAGHREGDQRTSRSRLLTCLDGSSGSASSEL